MNRSRKICLFDISFRFACSATSPSLAPHLSLSLYLSFRITYTQRDTLYESYRFIKIVFINVQEKRPVWVGMVLDDPYHATCISFDLRIGFDLELQSSLELFHPPALAAMEISVRMHYHYLAVCLLYTPFVIIEI